MKLLFKTNLVLTLGLVFCFNATAASILVEPYIGYKAITDGEVGQSEVETNGVTMGGRLGLQRLGLMGGLDFSTSTFDEELTQSGSTTEVDKTNNDLGLFIGYNAPVLVRVWASYFFSSNYTLNEGTSKDGQFKGSGFALGVGYTGLPFVSANLEYRSKTMDQYESPSGNEVNLDSDDEYNYSEILLSISLPLNF